MSRRATQASSEPSTIDTLGPRVSPTARATAAFTAGVALGVASLALAPYRIESRAALIQVAGYGALVAAVAAIDAGLRRVAARPARRLGWPRDLLVVLGFTALATCAAIPLGVLLGWSTRLERSGLALAVRVAAPIGLGLVTFALVAALAPRPRAGESLSRKGARSLALALGGACMVLDARVLVGLVPAAHAIWLGLAALVAWLGPGAWALARLGTGSAILRSFAAANASLLLAAFLALAVGGEAVRGELVLASPYASRVFDVLRVPPPPLLEPELSRLERSRHEGTPAVAGRLRAPRGASVLWITVDTLRADALPPARDERPGIASEGDTPRLDAFLASSFRFRRAYSQASVTHLSIPPTFHSIESSEDPARAGISLPSRMRALGLTPFASVHAYFVRAGREASTRLLDDFEEVSTFDHDEMGRQVPETLSMLERHADEPFFAWVHLFAVHDPGFDGEPLRPWDGSPRERYVRSLRWLDGQIGALLDGLRALGLEDRTVVALTSDHGEGLHDHLQPHHGFSVFDEETRVPLAIRLPGAEGRRVERAVGNIDLVPSLVELLSAPPDPSLRGRSFVALLSDDETPWDRSYFMTTANRRLSAVARGTDKLVFDHASGIFWRYDLARDPHERTNLYRADGALDSALRSELVRRDPAPFAGELREARVRRLHARLLARLDSFAADDREFLLRVADLAKRRAPPRAEPDGAAGARTSAD